MALTYTQSTTAIADAGGTVANTALTLTDLGFTATQVGQASRAWITASGQDLRYRYSGTAPTAGNGHYLVAGVGTEIIGANNIANLQFIRATGTSGAVWVTLEG